MGRGEKSEEIFTWTCLSESRSLAEREGQWASPQSFITTFFLFISISTLGTLIATLITFSVQTFQSLI